MRYQIRYWRADGAPVVSDAYATLSGAEAAKNYWAGEPGVVRVIIVDLLIARQSYRQRPTGPIPAGVGYAGSKSTRGG